ncbi:MAG: DUF58 domain-containing protein [Acidimicrobiia bacterium]|nr:DUF58 domain-containing protein [Acidimicrobiia bacterium]
MLTHQGIFGLVAGVAAVAIGRVFGVLELFLIGAAFLLAAAFALCFVRLRRPKTIASRWVHPSVLVAGDTGQVDIHLHHGGRVRSGTFELSESVRQPGRGDHVALLTVAPLAPGAGAGARYQLPTTRRGVITVGPLIAINSDPLGMARLERPIADVDEVVVAPRSYLLDMPQLGQGALGRHLLNQARRLGPGDFHSLRGYVDGDEPRSISWKASARSEDLLVKEYTVEGLRRCTVLLDAGTTSYADDAGFERAIIAAASIVNSADRAGLTTRFIANGGLDLRGPDVAVNTLRILARIEPTQAALDGVEREFGDGLGLLVVISGSMHGEAVRLAQSLSDPAVTTLPVTTDHAVRTGIAVPARTDEEFLSSWRSLTGRGRLDANIATTGVPDFAVDSSSDRPLEPA